MTNRFPEETIIRQYLLGRLDDRQELEESLSEEMLFNDELSEVVDSIEDEIIEEYLDGKLDFADRKSFEEYFLRPPERKQKLQFARLLREHFELEEGLNKAAMPAPPVARRSPVQPGLAFVLAQSLHAHARTYVELAAVLILSAASLVYIGQLQSRIAVSQQVSINQENALKQEREHSSTLTAQLQEALHPSKPLMLLEQPKLRGPGSPPLSETEIKPTTQRISISLILQGVLASSYDVNLDTAAGKTLWSAKLRPLISSSAPPQLAFDMPAEGITSGEYAFVVTPVSRTSGEKTSRYPFRAREVK